MALPLTKTVGVESIFLLEPSLATLVTHDPYLALVMQLLKVLEVKPTAVPALINPSLDHKPEFSVVDW